MERHTWLRWVRHAEVQEYLANGWRPTSLDPCHHHEYAILLEAPTGWTPPCVLPETKEQAS